MLIRWEEKFATGNALVDAQHRTLFDAVNAFDTAVQSGVAASQISKLLQFLDEYSQEHFACEEFLMLRAEFPRLPLHQQEHASLVSRVKFLKELRETDSSMVPVHGVASFLANWLENHILRWDMEFFDYIRDYPIDEP